MTWGSEEEYQHYLAELVTKFNNNFEKFDVKADIVSAGPNL